MPPQHQQGGYASQRADEALAWGIQHLVFTAKVMLSQVQGAADREAADLSWQNAWATASGFPGIATQDGKDAFPFEVGVNSNKYEFLTWNDIWDVNAKHQLRFSEAILRPWFEQYLRNRGITAANGDPYVLPQPDPPIPAGSPLPEALKCLFEGSVKLSEEPSLPQDY